MNGESVILPSTLLDNHLYIKGRPDISISFWNFALLSAHCIFLGIWSHTFNPLVYRLFKTFLILYLNFALCLPLQCILGLFLSNNSLNYSQL